MPALIVHVGAMFPNAKNRRHVRSDVAGCMLAVLAPKARGAVWLPRFRSSDIGHSSAYGSLGDRTDSSGNLTYLGFPLSKTYTFKAGLLDEMLITDAHDFSDVVAELTERYGKPFHIETAKLQNAYGAQFDARRAFWSLPKNSACVAGEEFHFDDSAGFLRYVVIAIGLKEAAKSPVTF